MRLEAERQSALQPAKHIVGLWCTAQLGLSMEEPREQELDVHDPRCRVLTTIIAHFDR